jgi:hypothetical protein
LLLSGIACALLLAGNATAGRDPRSSTRAIAAALQFSVRGSAENPRGLALGKLCAIKINADMDATIGGARERLHYGPIRQDIGGHVDFMLGSIDQGNVDVFQVFRRRVVNGRRRIGARRRKCSEQDGSGYN